MGTPLLSQQIKQRLLTHPCFPLSYFDSKRIGLTLFLIYTYPFMVTNDYIYNTVIFGISQCNTLVGFVMWSFIQVYIYLEGLKGFYISFRYFILFLLVGTGRTLTISLLLQVFRLSYFILLYEKKIKLYGQRTVIPFHVL